MPSALAEVSGGREIQARQRDIRVARTQEMAPPPARQRQTGQPSGVLKVKGTIQEEITQSQTGKELRVSPEGG
ncbi:hypothetical protein GCM10009414_15110 [Tatumella terrea]